MRSFKSLLVILTIILSSSLFAQADSSNLSNQLQAHLVNGFAFSYLNYLSPAAAIRYKIDVELSVSSVNNERKNNSGDQYSSQQSSYEEKVNSNSQSIGLSPQFLWISEIVSRLTVYTGAGPYFGYSRNYSNTKNTQANTNMESLTNESIYESSTFSVGAIGVLGLQCEITKTISVIAEYNLTAYYSWGNNSNENSSQSNTYINKSKSDYDSDSWNLSLSSIKLGIGFRF